MKKFFVGLINIYQKIFSPDQGLVSFLFRRPTCAFYPTCSEYTKLAIEKYGVLRGLFLGSRRVARCHPFQTKHIDPLV